MRNVRNFTELPSSLPELVDTAEFTGGRRLNVGIDIDGVLAPYHKPYEVLFGDHVCPQRKQPIRTFMHSISETAIATVLGKDRAEMFRNKDAFLNSDEALGILPITGAVEAVGKLATVHNTWLITSRVEGVRPGTERWLERYFPTENIRGLIMLGSEEVGVYASKKVAYKDLKIDVHVDDMPKHLNEARVAGVTGRILFGRYPWNRKNVASGSHRASNWEKALERVNRIAELTYTDPRASVRLQSEPVIERRSVAPPADLQRLDLAA